LSFSLKGKRVWVAGHRGMAGNAIVRRLKKEDCEILSVDRSELDMRRQAGVEDWVARNRPDAIFLAAARVGGILANDTYPATFIYDNLQIETNIIHAAWQSKVEKLLFLGSSCIYPKEAPQPIPEEALLTSSLEPTNEWYAIAKIAGIKLCQAYRRQYGCDFISAMPTNLYGPNDNFHPDTSHVPAALTRRFHEAKVQGHAEAVVWGSGRPQREFLHVDDLADACVFLMQNYSDAMPINVGSGSDVTIANFAELIRKSVGFTGRIVFDTGRPDGTPRKLLDSSRLRQLGWTPRISLEEGLPRYYAWFLEHGDRLRENHIISN
jgi:GDP-L-fucose synthase